MLNEQLARAAGPDRIDLAYERRGDPAHPTVLLAMGIAAQLVNWPEGFLDALVSHGLQVVRFDNRDSGHSSHLNDAPPVDMGAAYRGDFSTVPYTLSHMAADAVGLLDALGIDSAHAVGASMGGAIAQMMAIEHPTRVSSLTSMMFTTGDPTVGNIHPATMEAVFNGPPARTRDEVIARALRVAKVAGSPLYPSTPEEIAERAGQAFDRDHDETAPARQGAAVLASGDRTERLKKLDLPTLVVHGLADTLIDPSGGRATAAAIPGSELVLIDGMGHDLPKALWPRLAELIAANVRRGELRRQRSTQA